MTIKGAAVDLYNKAEEGTGIAVDNSLLTITKSTVNVNYGKAGIKAENGGIVNITQTNVYVSSVSGSSGGTGAVGLDGTGGSINIYDSYVRLSGNEVGARDINKQGLYGLVLSSNTIGMEVTQANKEINGGYITIAGNTTGIKAEAATGSLIISNSSMEISSNTTGIIGYYDEESPENKNIEIKTIASLTITGNGVGIANAKLSNVGSAQMLVSGNETGLAKVDIEDAYITLNDNVVAIASASISDSYIGLSSNTIAMLNTSIKESEISVFKGNNRAGGENIGLKYSGGEYTIENTNMLIKETTVAIKAVNGAEITMIGLCSGSKLEIT